MISIRCRKVFVSISCNLGNVGIFYSKIFWAEKLLTVSIWTSNFDQSVLRMRIGIVFELYSLNSIRRVVFLEKRFAEQDIECASAHSNNSAWFRWPFDFAIYFLRVWFVGFEFVGFEFPLLFANRLFYSTRFEVTFISAVVRLSYGRHSSRRSSSYAAL